MTMLCPSLLTLALAAILTTLTKGNVRLDNGLARTRIIHALKTPQQKSCRINAKALNLLIILDSSGSLKKEFEEERQVVHDLIDRVTPHPDFTRIALIQFSGFARTEFEFLEYNSTDPRINRNNLHAHVDGLRFIDGITHVGLGLDQAIREMDEKKGWRRSVPTIAFLVSDGRSFDTPRNLDEIKGRELIAKGADMYSYGTGEFVAYEELVDIVGTPKKVFTRSKQNPELRTYGDMLSFFSEYESSEVCEQLKLCVPGSDRPLDLLLLIDSSGSVESAFPTQLSRANDWISLFNVHPDAVRVAAIQFTAYPKIVFNFDDYVTNSEVEKALKDIQYNRGATRINEALESAMFMLRQGSGRRPNVPSAVVIMTDGHSQFPINGSAAALNRMTKNVYAVVYGSEWGVDVSELLPLTGGDWKRVFVKSNESLFSEAIHKLSGFSCAGISAKQGGDNNLDTGLEPVLDPPIMKTCAPDSVTLKVRTRKPIVGRLFVIGFYDKPGCYVQGDGKSDVLKLTIRQGTCGMEKNIHRSGHSLNVETMLQFHDLVITEADEYIPLDCFSEHSGSGRRSKVLKPEKFQNLVLRSGPTTCEYQARKLGSDGCISLEAAVGEQMYHTWTCNIEPLQSGMIIHSCKADDNVGRTMPLLDPNGCEMDQNLFQMPNYGDPKSTLSVMNTIWKFPTSESIRFTCKIAICDRFSGQCEDFNPKTNCVKGQLGKARGSLSQLPSFEVRTRWINVVEANTIETASNTLRYCRTF